MTDIRRYDGIISKNISGMLPHDVWDHIKCLEELEQNSRRIIEHSRSKGSVALHKEKMPALLTKIEEAKKRYYALTGESITFTPPISPTLRPMSPFAVVQPRAPWDHHHLSVWPY